MNIPAPSSQQSTAAANALSGDKTFRTVEFAITGDEETDMIAGVIAVLVRTPSPTDEHHFRACARILEYLRNRYQDCANTAKEMRERNEALNKQFQGTLGGLGGQQQQQPYQQPYQQPFQPYPWATTTAGASQPSGLNPPDALYEQARQRALYQMRALQGINSDPSSPLSAP